MRDGRLLRAIAAVLAVVAAFALVAPDLSPVSLVPAVRRTSPRHPGKLVATASQDGVTGGAEGRIEQSPIARLVRVVSRAASRSSLIAGLSLAVVAAAARRLWSAVCRSATAASVWSALSRFVPARRGPPHPLFL